MTDAITKDEALQSHVEMARQKGQEERGPMVGTAAGAYHDYHAAKQKLDIFAAILQMRHDLSVEDAADAAEKVFQKLCIPQPQRAPD